MTTTETTERVRCALCERWITFGEFGTGTLADYKVMKYGELQYIEIAHRDCVMALENTNGWEWDGE